MTAYPNPFLKQSNGLIVALLLCLGIFCSCNYDKIVISKQGLSDYTIMVEADADSIQMESAKILQNYISKITLVELPIKAAKLNDPSGKCFFIKTDETIPPEQIQIQSKNGSLSIVGGTSEATRNAVYEFLEVYLNCHWYAPDVEEIPVSQKILLPKDLDYKYNPDVTTRTVHSRLFYEHPDFARKLKVTTEAFPHYVPSARVHTFNRFVPQDIFYDTHPEYYALIDGKRLPTQLCLSNEEVYHIVKNAVDSLFSQFNDAQVISVSQNDNQQYCTCDNCSAIDKAEGGPSGSMVRFVNRISVDFPDKTISTLAYQYTRKPCKTKPLDNVLITLCSIECDRSGTIEEKCLDFAEDIRGWRDLTNNIRIWDYTTQFTNFLAPFPNLMTLQPNIKFLRDNHAKWIFEQHSYNPSELFELRSYVMANLLWNPDADVDALIVQFTNGYYQEAGTYIKQYIDLIHQKLRQDPKFFLFLYGDPSQAFNSYLNPDLLSTYASYFDQAEEAVADKPDILQSVKIARLGIDYAILEACRKNMSKSFSLSNGDYAKSLLENFKINCNHGDITMMNEMGFTVEEYFEAYKKSIDVAKRPNKAIGKKVTLHTSPKKYANEDPQTLTDGALGGSSFYSNWLGFEGSDMEAVIDLGEETDVNTISMAFLQVTNHVVFFPTQVTYLGSNDNRKYNLLGTIENHSPLAKDSKVNDIQYFDLKTEPIKVRYIKIKALNLKTAPYWHHAAGLPSWIFADEIIIN